MTESSITITPVSGKAGRKAFVELGRKFATATPHSVPQLRSEQMELLDPAKNPFFLHADVQLFMAERNGVPVGRITAHIDKVALTMKPEQGFGPGVGNWGYFDADDKDTALALISAAENWLHDKGMTRALGPISMSVWEEPGLLTAGHDHAPMIMMGHHPAHYAAWVENAGYSSAKKLQTYDLSVQTEFPPILQRIIKSGQRNDRIKIRSIDKKNFESEVRIVLSILNDAWSDNWGFVPFTEAEISYAAKKLKPIIHPSINRIAELDGKPVAFIMTLPDMNSVLQEINGKLFPFGWFKMLRWLRKPMNSGLRVPLMGVVRELHNSRTASQLAFMMISESRLAALDDYHSPRAEFGWVLDDNQGMMAIADAIGSKINREYTIYGKDLA